MHCIILSYSRPSGGQGGAYALHDGPLDDYDQAATAAAFLNANKSTPAVSYELVLCGGQRCRKVVKCGSWRIAEPDQAE
jgi:hypothetical protein